MRTLLLISSGLLSLVSVATAAVPERTTHVTSQGAVRQMRAPRQQVTAAQAQIPVAKEVPANTVEVPFTHDLGKGGTEVKNYTSINVNGDNRKWQYGTVNGYAACMVPNADNVDANDDWLITVPIHLPAGRYVLCLHGREHRQSSYRRRPYHSDSSSIDSEPEGLQDIRVWRDN